MAGKGLNVFVNIGAKLSSSVDSSIRAAEGKFARMGKVVAAESRAATRAVERIGAPRGLASWRGAAVAEEKEARRLFAAPAMPSRAASEPIEGGVSPLATAFKAAPLGARDLADARLYRDRLDGVGAAASRSRLSFLRMGEAVGAASGRMRLASAEAKADMVALEGKQASRSGALFGGLFGLYAAKKVMEPAAQFQLALTRMGNTAKVYGPDLDKAGRQILQIGERFGVGGSHAVDGAHAYIAAGLGMRAALAAMPATFKFTATTGLEADDSARAGIAVMHNLGVQAREVERAFDVMVEAQKHGKIQAADMARSFPQLTAAAQRLGITGVKGVATLAAAMEQVRFGTNDAGSAATNLNQLLQKLSSPSMVKSMKKIGVDLPGIWAEAQRSGGSYSDMVIDRLSKIKGVAQNPFLLGTGIGRDQARNALTSLLTYREEFNRTRGEISNSAGVLDRDWGRVSTTATARLQKLGAATQGLAIQLGTNLLGAEAAAAGGMAGLMDKLGNFIDRHPRISGAVLGTVGAFAGLRLASVGLAWATGFLNLQLLATKTQILSLGGGMIGVATRAFTALRTTIASAQLLGAVGGIRAVGAAVLTSMVPSFSLGAVAAGALDLALSPIGLAIGAVALAVGVAVFAFMKLRKIGAFFGPFGQAFMKALAPMAPVLRPVVGAMREMGGLASKIFSPVAAATWARWGDAAGTAVGNVARIILRLVDAMGKVAGWIGKVAGFTIGAQEGGPLSATAPATAPPRVPLRAMSGARALPRLAGARAAGGPVRGGSLYLVGEKGPEIFRPARAGRVLTTAASAAMLGATAAAAAPRPMPAVDVAALAAPSREGGVRTSNMTVHLTIQGTHDPHATAQEVRRALAEMSREQDARLTD